MVSIEEAFAALCEEAVHDYANAAIRVDCEDAPADQDVEPFQRVLDAARALALAVLDEFAAKLILPSKPREEAERAFQNIRARIEALGRGEDGR